METKEETRINQNLKLLAKSSFFVFSFLVLSKIFTYIYRIIIARTFGPEVYGIFSLSVMVLGWFVLFSSFGLSEGLIRFISMYRGKKEYNKIRYLLNKTISLYLVSGIISAIILFFLSDFIAINLFHNEDLIILLKIFSFLIPVYLMSNVYLSVLQAFEKVQWYSFIINVFQNFIKVVSLVLLLLVGLGTNSIAFSYFLGYLAILIIAYILCRNKTKEIFGLSNLSKKEKEKTFNSFISYSWPLLFVVAVSEVFYWTDTFFIGIFKGATDVGYYNAVVPIALLLAIIPEIFLKLFFPLINREYSSKNYNVVKQLSKQVGKWVFIITLPLFLVLFLFPGLIINILFGEEYLVGVNALRILAIGVFLSNLTWVNQSLISMIGKSKLTLLNLLITSIINIILNILLIPQYGIYGAAIATTTSKVIFATLFFVQVKYLLGFFALRRKALTILILSAIPTAVIFWIRETFDKTIISLALAGIIFGLIYLLLIFITKSLDKNDWMILRSLRDKIFGKY